MWLGLDSYTCRTVLVGCSIWSVYVSSFHTLGVYTYGCYLILFRYLGGGSCVFVFYLLIINTGGLSVGLILPGSSAFGLGATKP